VALPYVSVRIRLFTPSEGGRSNPVKSGYRPLAHFGEKKDGVAVYHGFELRLVDREWLEPGETAQVRLVPFHPELWPARMMGDRVRIYEGPNHVGDAYIESPHLDDP
jgi:hypothetical protein